MLSIQKIGFYAQLVDEGRRLSMHRGYTSSGAIDWQSYDLANALVGNANSLVNIEITLGDFEAVFTANAIIAIAGANCLISLDGQMHEMYRPIAVNKGQRLLISNIGKDGAGLRVYIALRGGFEAKMLFGSAANVKRERSGGINENGEGLKAGDTLRFLSSAALELSSRTTCASINMQSVHARFIKAQKRQTTDDQILRLGCVPGYQWNDFTIGARSQFLSQRFELTPLSDRMGMRLRGDKITSGVSQLYSQGLCNGAIQCSGDGQLIVMLNDRQTIGGYPVLGAVDAFSRSRLAQAKAPQTVQFSLVNALNQAARISMWRQQIKKLSEYIDQCLRS
ncbi:biotin-dependent carboxyltransferase family protein [Glaciecola siphonariae]|uniref:Biotin-dependent carboxyltransferase family protein n=1 Tax=Glaciecola siphonariae TaxID=521012 RepID=A0ABV9LSG0_9ALTE